MTRIALTFDDGPGPVTGEILDTLREVSARATFFVLGRNVEEAPWCGGDATRARSLVVRAIREGHIVGNHSYSHQKPAEYLSLASDLRRCDAVILECLRQAEADRGILPAREIEDLPVRLPYGIRIEEGMLDPRLPVLASMGRTHLHWTGDFQDWTLREGDGPMLARRMIEHVEKNETLGFDSVLDLHDSGTGSSFGYERPATALATRLLLEEARRRGWEIFTVG